MKRLEVGALVWIPPLYAGLGMKGYFAKVISIFTVSHRCVWYDYLISPGHIEEGAENLDVLDARSLRALQRTGFL